MKELSKKNAYWIPKNRYLELKYHCLQYWDWQEQILQLGQYGFNFIVNATKNHKNTPVSDPTYSILCRQEAYKKKCEMVDLAIKDACNDFNNSYMIPVLHEGITRGYSYDILRTRYNNMCGRSEYYKMYRAAFFNLDMMNI